MEKVTRVRLVLDPKSGPLGYLPYLSPLPLRPSHYCRCLSHGSHPAAPPLLITVLIIVITNPTTVWTAGLSALSEHLHLLLRALMSRLR